MGNRLRPEAALPGIAQAQGRPTPLSRARHGKAPQETAALEETSDEDLMLSVAQGDDSAFRMLAGRHAARTFALTRRMLGNDADAEEIVQEAMLRVWVTAPRWRPDAAFTTWLYRVTLNLCLNRQRRKPFAALDEACDPPDPSPTAAEDLERREMDRLVAKAIEGLPLLGLLVFRPIVRSWIDKERRANDMVGFALSSFSVFYGLLLGLLAVAAYQNFSTVSDTVDKEASSLAALYRDSLAAIRSRYAGNYKTNCVNIPRRSLRRAGRCSGRASCLNVDQIVSRCFSMTSWCSTRLTKRRRLSTPRPCGSSITLWNAAIRARQCYDRDPGGPMVGGCHRRSPEHCSDLDAGHGSAPACASRRSFVHFSRHRDLSHCSDG